MLAQTKNQRECFRLTYPPGAGPHYEHVELQESIEVYELSEGGFRTKGSFSSIECDDKIAGILHFADHSIPVKATVKRIDPDYTVYLFEEPLTTIELLLEQAAVRSNYNA